MNSNNWYLVRLFRNNKIMFCFVMLFIFFQQYFYLKDNSTLPWFVWSMYSHKEYLPDTVTQTELFINNKRVDITSMPIWQEATIMHTFDKYIQLKNNDFIDPMKEVVNKRISHLPAAFQEYIVGQIEVKKTAAEIGREGGLATGRKLSAAQRKRRARKGAKTRWGRRALGIDK